MLLSATKFVVIYYRSHWKLTQSSKTFLDTPLDLILGMIPIKGARECLTLTVQFPKTNDNTDSNKHLKFLVSFIVLTIAEVTEFVYSFV